eukprot:CAMPEP_0184480768 /NCGR_PEP_ID=MMETSP0113_2-20130426/2294_1 /TAXON_ID=91329 /ORGANISM="Norrisiella sphaerica, Strain BC52" /LENGTH=429 /DNA_ID=CAMNT_0026859481 /DNA_START=75 /DNA_END=1361 /DNA_ORIENTATION=+
MTVSSDKQSREESEWVAAKPVSPEDFEENPPVVEDDISETLDVFGTAELSIQLSPPSGYSYQVPDVDELDNEQGIVKAYVPFESLIYSSPRFTLELSTEGTPPRRVFSPKQIWLTPPRFDPDMYRLSASSDFIIWADEEGRVSELYYDSTDEVVHRAHYNKSSPEHDKLLTLIASKSPRYRVVGVDSEGRFLARCLRDKVSIDCTAMGAHGGDSNNYFWLDLGSAMPSYRFKGVAVVSLNSQRFFLLSKNGHLVCMETDNRMATWKTWAPPNDVSLEIIADAQVASPRGVFTISADGKLWHIDVEEAINDTKSRNAPPHWACHEHPEKTGPLAMMEAIAVEHMGSGSLFLITQTGNLVEWRIDFTHGFRVGHWIVHGMPDASNEETRLVSAPVAYVDDGTYFLFAVSEDGNLQEFQIALYNTRERKTKW